MAAASVPRVFSRRLSGVGMFAAFVFFALSLLPSLLPRTSIVQGIVSGVSMAAGYGAGTLLDWAWAYLGLPRPGQHTRWSVILSAASALLIGALTVLTVWRQVGWQNDVRALFGMGAVSPWQWIPTIVVTVVVGVVLLVLGRSLRTLFRFLFRQASRALPRRLSLLVGGIAFAVLLSTIINGVLVTAFFDAANQIFSVDDARTDAEDAQPSAPERSGSPDSHADWDSLGRQGRSFVASGPTVADLNAFHETDAQQPIRVYAGLKSADTLQGRADLVLDELIRTGAFDRDVLVVATTTGTGFLEANAVDTLEYLHNGNTAIVGVQYSYLPSWISLLADQAITKQTSRVVFETIHDYWSALDPESRPGIYLYGLSLGSFGVESILTSINVINDPVDGAFMTGPPFVNELWNEITAGRDAGSPASLPVYEDGQTARFTAQQNALDKPTGEWGPTRVIYLQHASDPVSFFSPDLAFDRPDWLFEGQRGPDVSPRMSYFPLVTMVQVGADLPSAGSVPEGFGHLYTTGENLDAWTALTQPDGWDTSDDKRLRAFLTQLGSSTE